MTQAPAVMASDDGRFAVRLPQAVLTRLFKLCEQAGQAETGGILIGRYDNAHAVALVEEILGPTGDSRAGRAWFVRGVRGLTAALERLWRGGTYYLGEWHFHPGGAPEPSPPDIRAMRRIASDPKAACPEPVLLVAAGGASAIEIGAFVVRATGAIVTLTVRD